VVLAVVWTFLAVQSENNTPSKVPDVGLPLAVVVKLRPNGTVTAPLDSPVVSRKEALKTSRCRSIMRRIGGVP